MTHEDGLLRRISWRDCCPWLILFRTFRLAVSTQLLLLALVGGIATSAGWRLADIWLLGEEDKRQAPALAELATTLGRWPGSPREESRLDRSWSASGPGVVARHTLRGPLTDVAERFVAPVWRLFDPAVGWRELAYLLAGSVWALLVWSLLGGAITRVAAVRLGRDERVGLREAVGYAQGKLGSYFGAPVLPLVGVAFLAVPLVVLGWLMRLDIGLVLAALGWPVVLVIAFLMALLLLGLLFGWPLMWATISTEGSDAFDAISRSYAYTFQRPLQYLAYAAVAAVFGLLGWLLVWGFAESVVALASWATAWGTGADRWRLIGAAIANQPVIGAAPAAEPSALLWFGAQVIALFVGLVRGLATAFQYSYFWCVAAAIYLLLRLDADQTELDDVHVEEDAAVSYGLPPLQMDESGVPAVAEDSGGTTPDPPQAAPAAEGSSLDAPPGDSAAPRSDPSPG